MAPGVPPRAVTGCPFGARNGSLDTARGPFATPEALKRVAGGAQRTPGNGRRDHQPWRGCSRERRSSYRLRGASPSPRKTPGRRIRANPGYPLQRLRRDLPTGDWVWELPFCQAGGVGAGTGSAANTPRAYRFTNYRPVATGEGRLSPTADSHKWPKKTIFREGQFAMSTEQGGEWMPRIGRVLEELEARVGIGR